MVANTEIKISPPRVKSSVFTGLEYNLSESLVWEYLLHMDYALKVAEDMRPSPMKFLKVDMGSSVTGSGKIVHLFHFFSGERCHRHQH